MRVPTNIFCFVFFALGIGWAICESIYGLYAYGVYLDKRGKNSLEVFVLYQLLLAISPFIVITIPALAAHEYFNDKSFKSGERKGFRDTLRTFRPEVYESMYGSIEDENRNKSLEEIFSEM